MLILEHIKLVLLPAIINKINFDAMNCPNSSNKSAKDTAIIDNINQKIVSDGYLKH